MTTYREKSGAEVVVCDGCGAGYDGRKVETSNLVPVDLSPVALAFGMPAGTKVEITDLCPDCMKARGKGVH